MQTATTPKPSIETAAGTPSEAACAPVDETVLIPWRAVCCLESRFPGTTITYQGTGTLVSPRVVVTAGHVVYDPQYGGWAERIWVIPARHGPGVGPFGMFTSELFRSTGGWVDGDAHGSPSEQWLSPYDYGAVILPTPAEVHGLMPFGSPPDDALSAARMNLAGYPSGGGRLWWCGGPLARVERRRLFYRFGTTPGESGSPLFRYDETTTARLLVGIHTSFIGDEDSAVRITPDVAANFQRWMTEFP